MSDRLEEARLEAQRRLEESRREAELRLAEVRTAVKTEVGVLPKKKYLLMALAAGAAGFAVALGRGRRRKRKQLRREIRRRPLARPPRRPGPSGRDRTLEDHRDVVGRPGLEVDGGDGHQLPPLFSKLVQLRRGVRIETVILASDVDDLVLPLAHFHTLLPGSGGTGRLIVSRPDGTLSPRRHSCRPSGALPFKIRSR